MSTINRLLDPIVVPKVVKVKQTFERPVIHDVLGEFKSRLAAKSVMSQIKPGQKIAVAVGSRGISNLPEMVKILVHEIKKAGAEPFIVPAMGSHGSATAEGQRNMLIGLGYTEEYVGAPIKATMETVQVGVSANGFPVFFDKYAYEADGTVFINRIKPHVAFRGPYESGLMKFITIGLGKQKGADICHDLGFGKMAENIPAMAKVSLAKTNILFAVGLVENAYHETCRIEVLKNSEIVETEPSLQAEAKRLCPKIYFDKFDVLILDEIGKDISGSGYDTNIVGRYHTPFCTGGPDITRIAVLDVTNHSHGNANGVGILDFTTKRLFDKFSFEDTYPNALTSTVPTSVKMPMVLKNDKQVFQACIKTCNRLDKENVTLIRVKNTLSLGEIEISENLIPLARENQFLEIVSEPYDLPFDDKGNLL
ncbi:lactate racemase domain-containing protein [Sporomusa aerivorans]|uniref:lactate racemase domain-containing protein n=1 Tax=Sporomusa aerivorans TaxID=204936 RepID=UPI00352AA5EA